MTIEINSQSTAAARATRDTGQAMLRGAGHCCPSCGKGSLYERYLKVSDHCAECGEALHHHRADDAPPYFTIFIVGHIVVGGILALEQAYKPSPWLHAAIWVPMVLVLSLLILPRIKGALVGLQWAQRMHGFGAQATDTTAGSAQPPATPQN